LNPRPPPTTPSVKFLHILRIDPQPRQGGRFFRGLTVLASKITRIYHPRLFPFFLLMIRILDRRAYFFSLDAHSFGTTLPYRAGLSARSRGLTRRPCLFFDDSKQRFSSFATDFSRNSVFLRRRLFTFSALCFLWRVSDQSSHPCFESLFCKLLSPRNVSSNLPPSFAQGFLPAPPLDGREDFRPNSNSAF